MRRRNISRIFLQRYLHTVHLAVQFYSAITPMHQYIFIEAVLHAALTIITFQKVGMCLSIDTCLKYLRQHPQYGQMYILAVALVNGAL